VAKVSRAEIGGFSSHIPLSVPITNPLKNIPVTYK